MFYMFRILDGRLYFYYRYTLRSSHSDCKQIELTPKPKCMYVFIWRFGDLSTTAPLTQIYKINVMQGFTTQTPTFPKPKTVAFKARCYQRIPTCYKFIGIHGRGHCLKIKDTFELRSRSICTYQLNIHCHL